MRHSCLQRIHMFLSHSLRQEASFVCICELVGVRLHAPNFCHWMIMNNFITEKNFNFHLYMMHIHSKQMAQLKKNEVFWKKRKKLSREIKCIFIKIVHIYVFNFLKYILLVACLSLSLSLYIYI